MNINKLKILLLIICVIAIIFIFFKYILLWINNPIFATVFAGTLVFVIQKIFSDLFLEPYLNYRKVVGEIDNKLKFYGNVMYSNNLPREITIETINALRKLSCDLESSYKMMLIKIRPKPKEISRAASDLMFLSNNTGMGNTQLYHENIERAIKAEKEVREVLGIPKLSGD